MILILIFILNIKLKPMLSFMWKLNLPNTIMNYTKDFPFITKKRDICLPLAGILHAVDFD